MQMFVWLQRRCRVCPWVFYDDVTGALCDPVAVCVYDDINACSMMMLVRPRRRVSVIDPCVLYDDIGASMTTLPQVSMIDPCVFYDHVNARGGWVIRHSRTENTPVENALSVRKIYQHVTVTTG
jgi:hypothetical protein